MTVNDLPTLNAILNSLSTLFLILGYLHIRKGEIEKHKKSMLSALIVSAVFLISYLIYHAQVGSVPYPHHDWTRPIYFAILIPHIILAAVNAPFVLVLVWFAWRERFSQHKRLARWVWPVWMFVSISGVMVYLMLYRM
jgi:uncharacterized membrane protein YozB (DUF420 family)